MFLILEHPETPSYQKSVTFRLEESQRIKDSFKAKENGYKVLKLHKGKVEIYFGTTTQKTKKAILDSGK